MARPHTIVSDSGTELTSTAILRWSKDRNVEWRHDFTIAIVAADDQLVSRRDAKHVPRDNVQLEYGISVGMLGRERSILLVDTDEEVKLASDQAGLTTLRFKGSDLERTIQKACIAARKHITDLGPLQDRPRTAA